MKPSTSTRYQNHQSTNIFWVFGGLILVGIFFIYFLFSSHPHHEDVPLKKKGPPPEKPPLDHPKVNSFSMNNQQHSSQKAENPADDQWLPCPPVTQQGGCPTINFGVCGDDGVTYPNGCLACRLGGGGAKKFKQGSCPEPLSPRDEATPCPERFKESKICTREYSPVCGSDHRTYPNTCTACQKPEVISFTPGPCTPIHCTADMKAAEVCTALFEPVCGNDGATYSNPCTACQSVVVVSYTPGECP